MVNLLKKLPLGAKLVLIGLLPTVFLLYVSFQYYTAEKQKLALLHNNITLISRAEAVNRLIEQLGNERRYGYEYTLRKDQYNEFVNQWKYTDSAIAQLQNIDPGLRDIKNYTLLDGLASMRQNASKLKVTADGVMGYYTTTIFRISYLDVTPELLIGKTASINQDIQGQKSLSEMMIYLSIINSNIYNVLYTHTNALGTLYGLMGLYQVYNTFEKEFISKAAPASVKKYNELKHHSALKPVIQYLDAAFKHMALDSTYNETQWWQTSGEAVTQLKTLQLELSARVNSTLTRFEHSEQLKVERLLILLVISLSLITILVAYTILDISDMLTQLRIAAEKIAGGETGLQLHNYPNDVVGKLAGSISKIDENNKMLTEAAVAIGTGNFNTAIITRGSTDLLGNAILRMKDDLRRFASENAAHAAELERLLMVIKRSETHFRQIADQIPLMIWQVDKNADAIYVNKQWIEFTGMSFESSMGLGWMEKLHPDDRNDRDFTKAFAARVPYTSRSRFRNADDEYRWMYIQGNPVFGENKEFEGFIGSLTDITEQIAAEQSLRELMHRKDEFLSIASHELRTPLTSIKAYTQLLEKNTDQDDKLVPFVNKTLKHVGRLEKLISDLLDVSRINSGRMVYDFEEFEFSELLKQSVESFADVSSTHKVIVENLAKARLKADRARIEQVFNNLLHNAAKYSPGEDTVLVNSYIDNSYIVISVKDQGVGIPREDQSQLFERFYRSEKTYNKFQGLGLGLFISYEIIKRHSGDIWVESEPGKGSVFYFKLPLQRIQPELN